MESSGFNNQISAYSESRPPKFHEIELLNIITKCWINKSLKFLDIGCASGSFLSLISSQYPESECHGFDISPELIKLAKHRLENHTRLINLHYVGD